MNRCSRSIPARALRRRSGLSIVLVVLVMVALLGFVSLAVDIGRVRLARAQLQTAADAGACSGAESLPVSQQAVMDEAVNAAFDNPVIDADKKDGERTNPGASLQLPDDVTVGIWDKKTRTFTELTDKPQTNRDERRAANAVWADARRLDSRGDPVPLIIAPVVGVFSNSIEREAIAYISNGPKNFGFVGLNYVQAKGNGAQIDGHAWPSTARDSNGSVASNGDINLQNGDVYGDARPGMATSSATPAIIQGPNSILTGWTASMDYKLDYPVTDKMASSPTPNNDAAITPPGNVDPNLNFSPRNNVTIPASANTKYYFNRWTHNGAGTVTITAPATIYINGNFTMGGTGTLKIVSSGTNAVKFIVNGSFTQTGGTIVNTGNPSNLYISVIKAGTTAKFSGNTAMNAHVYVPLSDVTLLGTTDFTGWIIGKSLTFPGTTKLHYDESFSDRTPYKITLVE